jgi:uncharacterized protein (TIGR00369 family)
MTNGQMTIDMPFAAFLGLTFEQDADGDWRAILPCTEALEGRPGFVHGGALAGMLECVAIHKVQTVAEPREGRLARPINLSISYLRGATADTCYAKAEIVRLGGRIIVVAVRLWQDDPQKPVVMGQVNLMR